MKKIVVIMLSIILNISVLNITSMAEKEYGIGEYYQLGRYNDNPILWRCVSIDDENGILMVSDKILCFKAANSGEQKSTYGNGFWEESTIRTWLNSTAEAGNIKWFNYPPDYEHLKRDTDYTINYPYDNEQGFLNENNFSENERSIIKTVTQWQTLPKNKLDLSTNGHSEPYMIYYSVLSGPTGETRLVGSVGLSELAESYKGAMYRISDTVFLMNEPQLYSVYMQLGTIGAETTETPINNSGVIPALWHSENGLYDYWLRSNPLNINNERFNAVYSYKNFSMTDSYVELGIRPAFYLNEDTAYIKSGSGTEDDPYILDGTPQDSITVFANGKQLDFAQPPIIENDSTLVGMRKVFETFGAEVSWNGENQTVTAVKGDTCIELQIDSNIMTINDEAVELAAAARLINDNTMVPLRAVSEAFDAKVEWIEDLQRVVIDVQPEWVESDWNPKWYQEAMRAGEYIE